MLSEIIAEDRMRRLESISRKVRQRFYYSVPAAGAKIELGRSQSYRAAEDGLIPTVRKGKFLLVPRKPWDRTVKRLLGRDRRRKATASTTTEAATA
jgi:hypothetical protein